MTKRHITIPDAPLEKLLSKVGSDYEPEPVPVHAEVYATPLNCFPNVREKVRRDGGKPHYGWLIHKTNLLYEAERHAVWENEEGNLVDVTPQEPSASEIQFVSDNNWVYTGQAVDNIRVNRTKNPLVDDFILLAETVIRALAYGSPANNNEVSIPQPALIVADSYRKMRDDLLAFIKQKGGPYSRCYCGSGRLYRSCHGSQLTESIKIVFAKLHSLVGNPD